MKVGLWWVCTDIGGGDRKSEVEIGNLDDIRTAELASICGDEYLIVTYNDGEERIFTGSDLPFIGVYVIDHYTVLSEDRSVNLLENDLWKDRKDAYAW